MKVYKFEVLVIDYENIGKENIVLEIENSRHIYPMVHNVVERDIEWRDDHPLNHSDTWDAEYD